MKAIATKIILVLLSITVFTTGMGATIVNFCCDNCVSSFFEEINITKQQSNKELHSCCTHQSDNNTQKPTCHHSQKNHQSEKTDCCKIERHSLILDSYHFKPALILPFTWISQQPIMLIERISIKENSSSSLSYLKIPPNIIDTKTYLAIIRILII